MKYTLSIIAFLSSFAFANASNAAEILITKGESKKAGAIALDIVSDGQATAFDFTIPLGNDQKINPKHINLKNCLSELPKTHTGACAYRAKKNDIAIFVYSPTNELLPKGIIGLGTISAPAGIAKSLSVGQSEFSAPGGKVIIGSQK